MPTSAPEKPRTKKAGGIKPADIQKMVTDITTHVLIDRTAEMRTIVLGTLAGVNVHQLGPPGSGKSLGLRAFAERITGARYFEKLVHAQMPADAIIGGYDMANFAKTGEFKRNVEHYAPNSHVVFIDEITRANGPTLDALLPMLNTEERRAEANGGMFQTPIMLFVTASNFMPEPEDSQFAAMVDRLTLMQYIDYVKSDESYKEMFRRHHERRLAEVAHNANPVTISVDQLAQAQAEVMAIELTPEFLDKAAELRRNAKGESLGISDRRWMELGRVCRASAWLAGRDHLIPEDLIAVEDGLWRDITERPKAHALVLEFHGRFEREGEAKRQEAAPAFATLEEIRPLVEGTPGDLDTEVLQKAIKISRECGAIHKRVTKLLTEAEKEKRDAATLNELRDDLVAANEWFSNNSLPDFIKEA